MQASAQRKRRFLPFVSIECVGCRRALYTRGACRWPLTKHLKSLLNAEFRKLVGIDDNFGQRDGLETGPHLEIKSECSIACRMRRIGIAIQACSRRFLRTYAFQNLPRLMEAGGSPKDILNLISARKRSAVEEHMSIGFFG